MIELQAEGNVPKGATGRKCSVKEDRFAREFVIDLEKRNAAIRAGYAKKAATAQATRLLGRVWVQDRIAELQAALAGRMDLTADGVVAQLMKDHKLAQEAGHHSAAVRATELLGKRLGLWIDRIRTEADDKTDEALADEVVDAALALAKGDKRLKARITAGLGILHVDSGKGETSKLLI